MNKFTKKLMAVATIVAAAICTTGAAYAAFTICAAPADGGNGDKDEQGHVLVSLWKEYSEAEKADRPQEQEKILKEIMDQSVKQNLAWDYCCAASEWYNVVGRRNWKLREESMNSINETVAGMDIPILTYTLPQYPYYIGNQVSDEWFAANVAGRAEELRKSRNDAFYTRLDTELHAFISQGIANDYEYLLWSAAWTNMVSNDEISKTARELLESEIAGNYPAQQYSEFRKILIDNPYDDENNASRTSALKEYSEKYTGKAVALLAEQQLLIDRLRSLSGQENATSDEFLAIRNSCTGLMEKRETFKGDEAKIAECIDELDRMVKYLDTQSIRLTAKDGVVSILLQNLESAELKITGEKDLGKFRIENAVCSYFRPDTVKFAMPDCPDGTYELKCTSGDISASIKYRMYSISLAYREIDTGIGIYAADYMTGRPIETADIEISQDGATVKKVTDFSFNGFTPVKSILDGINKTKRFILKCSYTDEKGLYRCSQEVTLRLKSDGTEERETLTGKIFMDRAAFNPGDTLQFKAIAYNTLNNKYFRIVEEGRILSVTLADPDNKEVGTMDLTTGEFGSVSGSFAIPEGAKGGSYSLKLLDGSSQIASSRLTVDEFVLPTFELKFDKTDKVYFSGDTVCVKGKLTSYSGHSVSSAKLEYEIESYVDGERKIVAEEMKADSDGSFVVRFKADDTEDNKAVRYYLTVKATELTGETNEWSKTIRVNPSSNMTVAFTGMAEGTAETLNKENVAPGLVSGDNFGFTFNINIAGLDVSPEIPVNYRIVPVEEGEEAVLSGTAVSGTEIELSLSGLPSGLYRMESEAEYTSESGHKIELKATRLLLRTSEEDRAVPQGVKYYYKKLENGRIAAQLGTSEAERWFVVEVYGIDRELLRSEIICLENEASLIDYQYDESYPDVVQMSIFSFRDGGRHIQSYVYERVEEENEALPLEFTVFTENAVPNGECRFVLQTLPGVEAVVSVFDKSTEAIRGNKWSAVRKWTGGTPGVGISSFAGARKSSSYLGGVMGYYPLMDALGSGEGSSDVIVPMTRTTMMTKGKVVQNADTMAAESANEVVEDSEEDSGDEIYVRERFDETIAFLPCLKSDPEGKIEFTVTPTDKLSTYYVSVFAHNKELKNNVLRREMTVTIPIRIAVVEPQFLYEGDVYRVRATVTNSYDVAFEGNVKMEVYQSEEPILSDSCPLTVQAGDAAMVEFEVTVPEGAAELGLKLSYTVEADGSGAIAASDAIYVTVPVRKATQTLTEAHSALMTGGADEETVKAALAKEFTGVAADGAEYKEISLLDMVLEAIPEKVSADGKDVITMSDAFYAGRLAESLKTSSAAQSASEDLIPRILDCQNSDGGFGWFEDFNSSQIVTAVVLERFAGLRDRGLLASEVAASLAAPLARAVRYLDDCRFADECPTWCGGLSLTQYLHVRTRYPDVKFAPAASSSDDYKTAFSKFKETVKDYLLPGDGRGLEGDILGKARRVDILLGLASDAADLASVWGLKSASKLRKSAAADMQSIAEYSVEHSSGGVYYPNAVLPFRGLLESEAYAHSLLCDLNEKWYGETGDAEYHRIAEGIRLWLMVQKESQEWDSDPGYLDALSSVLDGSEETLSSKVAVMSVRYSAPMSEVVAAGNGFTIERKFYVERADVRTEISEGESVDVGDKVIAEYHIWSGENRSFVRMETPRYASLRPVRQTSGMTGGLLRRLTSSTDRIFYFVPSTYMEIKADRTVWSFDVCPEETTVLTEEFYVTQAGEFSAPAVSIESLYAPHYRANDSAPARLIVE